MLTGAPGTLAAALFVLAVSVAIGAGVLVAAGRREWSWTAPAIGLAAGTVLAWWAVRLPGHGVTALIVVLGAAITGGTFAVHRLDGFGRAAREGAPVLVLAGLGVLLPFVVEGHFGVLGTGFNVDMSQHLFAADWIADPQGAAPGLYEQGYPLGPHGLAVAAQQVSGDPVSAFTGVTIALPVLISLTALASVRGWSGRRAVPVALLGGFAYLVSSYFAQGSFKELFEVLFLLGFALWLGELAAPNGRAAGWRGAIPGAVLGAGALYAYSAPGLAWLGGTLVLWAAAEAARRRAEIGALARRALPITATGFAVLALLAVPELDRIVDFGGSVGTVSEAAEASEPPEATLLAARGDSDSELRGAAKAPQFDNDLGNLFGQISPLEALGVWPSGDFRVAPGDGAAPAAAFYAGALLGALALAFGIAFAVRDREVALLAALAAAIAIWVAARVGSTPYTAAKALALVAPLASLAAVRGLLRPEDRAGGRDRAALLSVGLGAAFAAAAGLSAVLALASAPVGPPDYTPGVRDLSEGFAGRPTLLLAPPEVITDRRGEEFFGWELREASPACIASTDVAGVGAAAPAGIERVLTLDGRSTPPYADLRAAETSAGVTLWTARREAQRGSDAICPAVIPQG